MKSPKEDPINEDPSESDVPAPRLDNPENDKLLLNPVVPKHLDFDVDVCPIVVAPIAPTKAELCVPLIEKRQINTENPNTSEL